MTCYGSGNADRMTDLQNDQADLFLRSQFLRPGDTSYSYAAAEFAKYVTAAAQEAANDRLAGLTLDSVSLDGFDPAVTEYTVRLEEGAEIPEIAATAAYDDADVTCTEIDSKGAARVAVTSADGRYQQVNSIAFQGAAVAVPGDLNRDGAVNIQYVMEACKVLVRKTAGKEPTADEMARGSLDGDEAFTMNDVMVICKILARQA